jgi:hypothetical protein
MQPMQKKLPTVEPAPLPTVVPVERQSLVVARAKVGSISSM